MRYFLLSFAILGLAFASLAAELDKKFTVSEFTFEMPAGWEGVKVTSPMRKAQLKVPGEGKTSGDVIFFHFGPGAGGDTKSNIDRWLSQFQEPKDKLNAKTEEVKVKGRKITYVQAEGTYLSGMPGEAKTPQPGTTLLGAILDSEEGNVFIRFTGPTAVAKTAQPAFRKMIEGAVPTK